MARLGEIRWLWVVVAALALVGSALLSFSPITLDISAWGMSEPLHIVLVLLSLVNAGAYIRTNNCRA